MTVPFLEPAQIERAATGFLEEHHPSLEIPIPIEHIVELGLGLDIIPVPSLHQVWDVDGFLTSDLSSIYVDEFLASDRVKRYRFTLAHEVGHIVLHGEHYKQLSFSKVAEWKDWVTSSSDAELARIEHQANQFAGVVLVPPQKLREHCQAAMAEIRGQLGELANSFSADELRQVLAMQLTNVFEVSEAALRICLQKQGLPT